MQSVCSVIPAEFNRRVIDARADLSEDPTLGAIYDPPFAHFTHQLAEDYDWDRLEPALAQFARTHQPFEARTVGLLCFTGNDAGITVAVYRSPELVAYHDELWQVISPFTQGRVSSFYEPPTWLPHITIKRCARHFDSFGSAMAKLSEHDFAWTMTIDNVSVQHDPENNSQTHYQRLSFPLGGESKPRAQVVTNADVLSLDAADADGASWTVRVRPDGAAERSLRLTAPQRVRLMAACDASSVYFAGGRCRIEADRIVAVEPKTPHPVV